MADTDLIARVYPQGLNQENIIKTFETSSRFVSPPVEQHKPLNPYHRGEREPTEPPDGVNVPEHHFLPCIELRFDNIPRSRHGIVFGADPDSDVVLPNSKGLSYHHFTFTFDNERRPIVKDWGSLVGTEVTYDDQGAGKRSGFQWIVGGHPVPEKIVDIRIKLDTYPPIKLQIIVAPQNTLSPVYMDKVDRFRQGAGSTQNLFDELDIPKCAETRRPTGAHTPDAGKIYLHKKIGEGVFAVVYHYWNVSNGKEYALKEANRGFDVTLWEREVHIMKLIAHPNIVRLFCAEFTPKPQLYLEYVPGGSLREQENLSIAECAMVLYQCLSALDYLHRHDPPIVHRDIKAENILVVYREGFNCIEVKFGDFGLSKDDNNLSTFCGTRRTLAPEVYENEQYTYYGGEGRMSYTEAVDIWSLGVTVYGLWCAFPKWTQEHVYRGRAWATEIIKKFGMDLDEQPHELKQVLLDAMVVIPLDERLSAQACLAKVERLLPRLQNKDYCGVPKTGSYAAAEDVRTIIPRRTKRKNVKAPQTAIRQLSSSGGMTVSSATNKTSRQRASATRPSAPTLSLNRKRPKMVPKQPTPEDRYSKRVNHGSLESLDSPILRTRSLPSDDDVLVERGQDRNAYETNEKGEDSGYVKSPCRTGHLPTTPNLGIDDSLTDDAQGPQQHAQDWGLMPSQPVDHSSSTSTHCLRKVRGKHHTHAPDIFSLTPPRA